MTYSNCSAEKQYIYISIAHLECHLTIYEVYTVYYKEGESILSFVWF